MVVLDGLVNDWKLEGPALKFIPHFIILLKIVLWLLYEISNHNNVYPILVSNTNAQSASLRHLVALESALQQPMQPMRNASQQSVERLWAFWVVPLDAPRVSDIS